MERLSPAAQLEIEQQRRQERAINAQCEVFDVVAQFIMGRVLDQRTTREAVDMAIGRFGNGPVLPNMMIASLVGRQIANERAKREVIAKLPPVERRDRLGRPIPPAKSVVVSGQRRIA